MNCGKKIPDMLILVIYLPPAMLFFNFVKKNPDMLILVLYLPLAKPLWIVSEKVRYADFSPYYLTYREVACIFVWTYALDLRS
jgi:hypothetical protein